MPEPRPVRAVFAPEDFQLLATAVLSYAKQIEGTADVAKFANLYHRLGRICSERASGR